MGVEAYRLMSRAKPRRPWLEFNTARCVMIVCLVGTLHWSFVSYNIKRGKETSNAVVRLEKITALRNAELQRMAKEREDLIGLKDILEKSLEYERNDMLAVIEKECAIGQLRSSLDEELVEELNHLREDLKESEKLDIEKRDGELTQLDSELHGMEEEVRHIESLLYSTQRKVFRSKRSIPFGDFFPRIDEDFMESYFQRLLQPTYSGPTILSKMNCPRIGNPIKFQGTKVEKAQIWHSSQVLIDSLPDKDIFHRESPNEFKFNTCAVVGSSGILLKYLNGQNIDEHSAVIRFDRNPTIGFEDYTGSKTTLRFVDRKSFGYHEKSSEIVLHQVTTEQGFKDFLNLKNDFPITNGYIISPEFHAFVTEEVDEALSTWFYGLVHALQFCSQITIFGYASHPGEDSSSLNDFPYHYFDSASPPPVDQHSAYKMEETILYELVRRGKNRIDFAEPCTHPDDCQNPSCGGPEENRGLVAEMAHSRCVAPEVGYCSCQSKIPLPRQGFCQHAERSDCFWRCSNQPTVSPADEECI